MDRWCAGTVRLPVDAGIRAQLFERFGMFAHPDADRRAGGRRDRFDGLPPIRWSAAAGGCAMTLQFRAALRHA